MTDDELKDYDLSAWEAPPPPDDLADSVIERMGGTDIAAAIPVEPRETRSRRMLLIGGVAAAVLAGAVGTYALVRSTRQATPSSGEVIAERPRTLSLDTARAELDAGAIVRWSRRGGALHVDQRGGTAVWRVDEGETLVIDAGATVASVEATGASLRVEVQMNAMDAKIIGASALTAAAVAMVTVVVYEGHVKVRGADQTVVVQPGSTYRVEPPRATEPGPVVSGIPSVDEPEEGPNDVTLGSCDEVSCVLRNWEGACCEKLEAGQAPPPTVAVADTLGRQEISATIRKLLPKIVACKDKSAVGGKVVVRVEVLPDGSVRNVEVTSAHDPAVGACVAHLIGKAKFPPTVKGGSFSYPFMFGGKRVACDATQLKDDGMELTDRREHAGALDKFEASLACQHDSYVISLAFMAACQARNSPKAMLYYKKLSPAQRMKYQVMCIRNKVAYDTPASTPAPGCDAGAFKDKGMQDVNMGQHAAALAQFEASLRCEHDPDVVALAFMASCNLGNSSKAKQYYRLLDASQQQRFSVICVRNKVAYDDGAVAPPCDANDLKEQGMESVTQGQHGAALSLFEASLRCKSDPSVTALAFMAACNSHNATAAALFYKKLSPSQQGKYKIMCERNKVPLDGSVAPATGDTKGYLQVFSKPAAKILVDGVDTGMTTPISGQSLALPPGKHKITFVVAGDRYAYPVVIEAGATETLTKDLQ
jgi:hypothetical protein